MMSHLDLIGNKKRKKGERIFRFKSFGEPGYPVDFVGPFRENVKALLEFGHLESSSSSCREMPSSWSFLLELHRHPPVQILLFVIEEPVEASLNPHCKHCQYVGNVSILFVRVHAFLYIDLMCVCVCVS
jgi:hypothetical protein